MDITQIVIAVIGLCVALCAVYLIPTLRKKYGQEKINEALSTIETYVNVAKIAVNAAEQMGLNLGWDGEKKLQEAMDYAEKKLTEMGITYDETTLRKEIEAAVYEISGALKGDSKSDTVKCATSGYIRAVMDSGADLPTPTVTTTAVGK